MYISSLKLKSFRNLKQEKIDFCPNLNVLVGSNAQGKTNILEAIFFCVIGKSFKTNREKDVILWGENQASISATIQKKYRSEKVDINFSSECKKQIKIDQIPIRKIGELLGVTNAIFFSPQELKLVKDSPEERRRFMNIDLSQTSKRYFYALNRYEKVLANRNKLLKTTKDFRSLKDSIDIWDRALVEIAEKIYTERAEFVKSIAPFAEKAHSYLSGGSENLRLEYVSVPVKEDFKLDMTKLLKKNLEKDYKLGYTSVGIHRDEINIYLNDTEVKSFGSQGQQRTVALSLKLAELEIIKEKTGEYPILLLDDVFSELDPIRRARLLNFTTRTQTIITTTDMTEKLSQGKVFKVEKGRVLLEQDSYLKN